MYMYVHVHVQYIGMQSIMFQTSEGGRKVLGCANPSIPVPNAPHIGGGKVLGGFVTTQKVVYRG